MTIPAVEVFVCATGGINAAQLSSLLPLVSTDERFRQERFAFAEDRRDYVASHALLRLALARRVSTAPELLRFGATERGKPFLVPVRDGAATPSFSLAHSRDLVACALRAQGPVGVDVERIDECARTVSVAERFFAPEEVAELERCASDERAERFCELWTLKEAYVKALGVGLGESLGQASFSVSARRVAARFAPDWTFALADVESTHKLAVAASGQVDVQLRVADPVPLTGGVLTTREPVSLTEVG